MSDAAARAWREQLLAWAIPDRFLHAAAESPWQHSTAVFARHADTQLAKPVGVSWQRAVEALGGSGTVLDVGCGAGAASLPLAPQTSRLFAVDTSADMLDALVVRATALDLAVTAVRGRWPDVAGEVGSADVVLCHHVFYNVPDLAPFAAALTSHARRRVVVELPAGHPMRGLNPLWRRLQDYVRPEGPTADDALAVLRELGIDASSQRWPRPQRHLYPSMDELVANTRRRLCLPAERDGELVEALLELGVDPAAPRDLTADDLVTLWWDV